MRPRSLGERVFLMRSGGLRPYVRVLLFVFCVMLIQVIVSAAVSDSLRELSFWHRLFWSSTVFAVLFLALTWVFLRFIDNQDFEWLGLSFRQGWGRELSTGLAVGTSLQLLVFGGLVATHSVRFSIAGGYDIHIYWRVAANVLLFAIAGAVEELAFRGYALKWLMWSVGTPAALVLSGICFGVAHRLNPNATFFSTLNIALAGILLAVPYVRTRSMWMQIGLHWSWNVVLCAVVSLPVSGIKVGPNVFVARDAGPHWLTGGNFGPEGGAVVTIVSVVGIAVLLSTQRLKPSPSTRKELQ